MFDVYIFPIYAFNICVDAAVGFIMPKIGAILCRQKDACRCVWRRAQNTKWSMVMSMVASLDASNLATGTNDNWACWQIIQQLPSAGFVALKCHIKICVMTLLVC